MQMFFMFFCVRPTSPSPSWAEPSRAEPSWAEPGLILLLRVQSVSPLKALIDARVHAGISWQEKKVLVVLERDAHVSHNLATGPCSAHACVRACAALSEPGEVSALGPEGPAQASCLRACRHEAQETNKQTNTKLFFWEHARTRTHARLRQVSAPPAVMLHCMPPPPDEEGGAHSPQPPGFSRTKGAEQRPEFTRGWRL